MPTRTKIEINPAIVRRLSGLDDLAHVIFPDNRNHRRTFVAIWLALKYAQNQFLPSLSPLCEQYDFSERILDTVRARMKKLGLLQRISCFNPTYGYRAGWTFSTRFSSSLTGLAQAVHLNATPSHIHTDEQKDRDSLSYV